jgi:hypothetical protein
MQVALWKSSEESCNHNEFISPTQAMGLRTIRPYDTAYRPKVFPSITESIRSRMLKTHHFTTTKLPPTGLFHVLPKVTLPADINVIGDCEYFNLLVKYIYHIISYQLMHRKFNPLTPNDHYIGRTAPLTSRRCIFNIYPTTIRTEYFKHAA